MLGRMASALGLDGICLGGRTPCAPTIAVRLRLAITGFRKPVMASCFRPAAVKFKWRSVSHHPGTKQLKLRPRLRSRPAPTPALYRRDLAVITVDWSALPQIGSLREGCDGSSAAPTRGLIPGEA